MRPAHDVTEILEKNNDSGNGHVSLIIDAESVIPEFQRDSTKSWTVSYTDTMCREKKINELCELLKERPVEEIDGFIELARSGNSATMLTSFVNASTLGRPGSSSAVQPIDGPPLWAERTTGREVSPVDWIKLHYGNKDKENWDAMGLTRADLRLDMPLYLALAKWLKRNPEEAGFLPMRDYRYYSDEELCEVAGPGRAMHVYADLMVKRKYDAKKKRYVNFKR